MTFFRTCNNCGEEIKVEDGYICCEDCGDYFCHDCIEDYSYNEHLCEAEE